MSFGIHFEQTAKETHKEDPQVGKEMREELLEKLAIKTEKNIVHEVTHLLHTTNIFKDERRIIKWLRMMKEYLPHLPGDEVLIKIDTDEERKIRKLKYEDTEIERRVEIMEKMFMDRYYPDYKDLD